jgi:hypothetical protein
MARALSVPRLAALLALVVQLGHAPGAAAQAPAEVARQLSTRAHAAYRAGNHQEALDLLGAAYRLDPRPVLLYNMGRVLEATDKRAALREYRRCVEQPACPPAAAERVAALEPEVRALEEAARASAASPAPASPATRDVAAPPPAERPPSPWPWVVCGAGAAGLAAGIVTAAVGSARNDEARDEPAVGRAQALQDEADTLATWANVGLVGGATLLVAGAVWGTVDLSTRRAPQQASAASWTLRAGATSVSLHARF